VRAWLRERLLAPDAVACVTFPRSGHHHLVELLARVLGERLRYRERATLLGVRGANLVKHHDERLMLRLAPGRRALVQIRHPLPATLSRYEQRLRTGELTADTPEAWAWHARVHLEYWCGFFRKWVESAGEGRCVVRYEALLHDPVGEFAERVLPFLDLAPVPDRATLGACLARPGEPALTMDGHFVRHGAPRDPRTFRHHDAAAFEALLAPVRAIPEAVRLGYADPT